MSRRAAAKHPEAALQVIDCRTTADDPKETLPARFDMCDYVNYHATRPTLYYTEKITNDKAKPAERRGRKATGPRFLREAKEDSPKDLKTAGLR